MTEKYIENKRLLGALDYIDEKFIAEVTEGYKIFEEPAGTVSVRRTLKITSTQFAALAACLLLLLAAFPIVNYVVGVINSYASGRESTSENTNLTEAPEYDEELASDFDPNVIITEADLEMINIAMSENAGFEVNIATVEKFRAQCLVYGKCGNSLIFAIPAQITTSSYIIIGNYLFYYPAAHALKVIHDAKLYSLYEAYSAGLLTYGDIIALSEYHSTLSALRSPTYTGPLGGYVNNVEEFKNNHGGSGRVFEK